MVWYICTYQESLEYWKSLPLVEKTMRATSASQRTEISCAFFSNPDLLFENVTCLLILFSILFNCTLPLPISLSHYMIYYSSTNLLSLSFTFIYHHKLVLINTPHTHIYMDVHLSLSFYSLNPLSLSLSLSI